MLLAGGGFAGAVLFGFVPGTHGLATVADVPLGREALAEEVSELVLDVVLVEGLVVEGLVLVEELVVADGLLVVEVPVVPVLDGAVPVVAVSLQGPATVGWVWRCAPPVTLPELPATPGVP